MAAPPLENISLFVPLNNPAHKLAFINQVWRNRHLGANLVEAQQIVPSETAKLELYFHWLRGFLRAAYLADAVNPRQTALLRTYTDLFTILHVVQRPNNRLESRIELFAIVRGLLEGGINGAIFNRYHGILDPDDPVIPDAPATVERKIQLQQIEIQSAIEVAIRIWLFISLGDGGLAAAVANGHPSFESTVIPLEWNENDSLENNILQTFYPPNPQISDNLLVEFESLFNFQDIFRLTGFKPNWTRVISDHLTVKHTNDGVFISIYHDTGLLLQVQDGYFGPEAADFVAETFKTLSLLIPYTDNEYLKWFKKQRQKDPNIHAGAEYQIERLHWKRLPVTRRVQDYKFWRSRLLALHQHFHNPEPRKLRYFVWDRRKSQEWWTFWIAFVGFILALIALLLALGGLVTGVLSVQLVKAANSMASVASKVANETAAQNGSTAAPIAICCNPAITGSTIMSSATYLTPTSFGPVFTPSNAVIITVTEIVTALVTITSTDITSITSTISTAITS